jgi:hypothetical protein
VGWTLEQMDGPLPGKPGRLPRGVDCSAVADQSNVAATPTPIPPSMTRRIRWHAPYCTRSPHRPASRPGDLTTGGGPPERHRRTPPGRISHLSAKQRQAVGRATPSARRRLQFQAYAE